MLGLASIIASTAPFPMVRVTCSAIVISSFFKEASPSWLTLWPIGEIQDKSPGVFLECFSLISLEQLASHFRALVWWWLLTAVSLPWDLVYQLEF